jgi:hypothetical protein
MRSLTSSVVGSKTPGSEVRHITPTGLDGIETLLDDLRRIPCLVEKKRGVFYRKSKAFLHFHEHGDDVYADCRLDGSEFARLRVTTKRERDALVRAIRGTLIST